MGRLSLLSRDGPLRAECPVSSPGSPLLQAKRPQPWPGPPSLLLSLSLSSGHGAQWCVTRAGASATPILALDNTPNILALCDL